MCHRVPSIGGHRTHGSYLMKLSPLDIPLCYGEGAYGEAFCDSVEALTPTAYTVANVNL